MTATIPASGIVACLPDNRFLRRRYQRCPVDECITEQVVRFELWHGPTIWCTRCGDTWSDGEMLPRPLARGWRRTAQRAARRLWDLATYGPAPTLAELDPLFFAEHGEVVMFECDVRDHGDPVGWTPNLRRKHRAVLGDSHAEIDDRERQLADAERASWPGE